MESTISAAPQISIDREKTLRSHRRYWVLRRAQDIVFSLLALILLAPLALLISLAIVLDSPGDGAIFRQRRVGRDGKLFWLYKFRTMCPDAEEQLNELLSQNQMDGPVFKIEGDPRITRVGRFLRKTSLDELPQLLNVLRGDMSIVGPRPALPREVELYSDYQRQRLYVTPGLSCYWQIAPHRNEMSFDEWVALDLKYIQERSFWVDWKIIFLTVRAMLMKYGE
ncbi:multidrug MFS transporter [Faecalibacterium prausnitzii]|jgi:lipopolysaccharide/colanic/teichoic acid biosynthesis glycosyltransferase|uniref:Multidrug MFS transporter n=1 Tax=Faecalibacterium prausnitzii TaxID=853 RepID=A0A367FYI3_9FIRM|nr:sugar transferase [Faecalibacterium prausnitzii]MDU8564835.1 sugar transferase [Faecalibacterium prausnitzii]MSC44828.1 sugar transferase [Faecalibacterium prausnitzii]MSC48182.1 sugar transferase [Faecalibacterium prausnitzii]MSC68255.1 sugar transferase [Faecalibacterium prausnitzii]MSC75724.1 sugar transferase [Faecalibacterium prausnitzii]